MRGPQHPSLGPGHPPCRHFPAGEVAAGTAQHTFPRKMEADLSPGPTCTHVVAQGPVGSGALPAGAGGGQLSERGAPYRRHGGISRAPWRCPRETKREANRTSRQPTASGAGSVALGPGSTCLCFSCQIRANGGRLRESLKSDMFYQSRTARDSSTWQRPLYGAHTGFSQRAYSVMLTWPLFKS